MDGIMELFGSTKAGEVVMYVCGVLRKALKYPKILQLYSKDIVDAMLDKHIAAKTCEPNSEAVRGLKMMLQA